MIYFPICFILCIFLSAFTPVNAIPGYFSVDKDCPNYINFYLKPNLKALLSYAITIETIHVRTSQI